MAELRIGSTIDGVAAALLDHLDAFRRDIRLNVYADAETVIAEQPDSSSSLRAVSLISIG